MDIAVDRIERQIDIAASAEKVWGLVSRPGWFINDGFVINHTIERQGDLDIVHDPVHGAFPIRTVKLDPPRYAAFRWLSQESAADSTLIEFWIDEHPGGTVTLRVAESGFTSLSVSEEERRQKVEGNTQGWEIELAAARSFLDPSAVQRSVHIAGTREQVWPILTEAGHLANWYALDGAEIQAHLGGAIELRRTAHGTYRAQVVTVDEPERFAFRIGAQPQIDPNQSASTLVTFALKASGAGCLLTVTHSGFEQLDPRFGNPIDNVAAETEGWEGSLATLAGYWPTVLNEGTKA